MMGIQSQLIIFALVVFSQIAFADQKLSDNDAISIIEAHWNKTGSLSPMKGNFTVVSRGPYDWSKGTITISNYKDVEAWSKLGFIKITVDKNYEDFKNGQNFSLSKFSKHMDGVQKKIALSPTSTGLKYKHQNNPNWLFVPFGEFEINKIVKNEERVMGVDNYRIIMVKYLARFTRLYNQFANLRKKPTYTKRKAIVLLKWDPFETNWEVVTFDIAEEDKDFTTKNVVKRLSK